MKTPRLPLAQNFSAFRKNIMDTEIKFQEQDAPAKNTDNAFVKVAEDGSPLVPDVEDKKTATKGTGSTDEANH